MMRASTLILLCCVLGCASRVPDAGDTTAAPAGGDTVGAERPLWQFGESTVRTDSLPAGLDSLREWGDYGDSERLVAYAVDVNHDGRTDWLVRTSTRLCGPFGGCGIRLLTRDTNGQIVAVLDDLARDVMITNRMVNGWPVLWTYLGGIDGGVFRMEFRDGKYRDVTALIRSRDRTEWTAEQYAADSIWQRMQSVRVP